MVLGAVSGLRDGASVARREPVFDLPGNYSPRCPAPVVVGLGLRALGCICRPRAGKACAFMSKDFDELTLLLNQPLDGDRENSGLDHRNRATARAAWNILDESPSRNSSRSHQRLRTKSLSRPSPVRVWIVR